MINGQADYYFYCARRINIVALEEMLEFYDKTIYQNRIITKAAIGLLKYQKKVDKVRESEIALHTPALEAYLKTDGYKALLEKKDKDDPDDEEGPQTDIDPEGYKMYMKFLKG